MKLTVHIWFATLGLAFLSCNEQKKSESIEEKIEVKNKNEKMEIENKEIKNVALMCIKEGEEERFEEYKRKGGAILEKYGGKIERIVEPKMLAKGEMELPSEIHFAPYPSLEVFNKFNQDEEFIKIRNEYAVPALKDISVFTCYNTDFEFKSEKGDIT
ncbi:hypothetical protein D2V08_01520 [Flagellimonas lutimaris]|uniref:DUF1330 domain-containing protein n=1 Tax=Flagellimonas lutimaris TaxID=475082 RepID=A0A3A1NAU8_9FLAO|nr:hypothetical protein [Allomuricauda lutimaris]RIV36688.1 hypothetical protein D2V08_01520 [Allomuricauda lutimaris]